ncbi:MAG: 50S ribosomal protein L18e [Candidatus Altiarchaeales archaeon]|nr:MAG: 50S ribosomal protein L18e [Candidatus Altiarchaeales archaeon]RLI94856.1 MAG: 50S ribosomal protein L18e [Candidatus Altiarchaeales archaeon]HDO82503.1 50S ribosomal protein L18e [Candidatus Altiarchaeales archaeon]HEX55152.1 50S ribosomal protein L18e [Candidatus Altiarchaeales archaeon]
MPRTNEYEDPNRLSLIRRLKKFGRENNARIWIRVAEELSRSRRNRRVLNLWKLNRYANDGETVIVPGKVLGDGNLNKKLNVAAFKFSESAKEKINNSGSEFMTIDELMKKNPTGRNVKIIC